MKRLNWLLTLTILFALGVLLGGCGPSTQSGVNKEYDMRAEANGQSTINLHVVLDATTAAETESGDAGATLDLEGKLTAAWDAAQAQGVDEGLAFLKDVQNWLDKRFAPDNSVDNNPPAPAPIPTPEPGPIPEPDPDEPGTIDGIAKVLYTYKCEDLDFAYKDCDTCEKVDQLVCTFTDFDSCDQIPANDFIMLWKDPTGNERTLEVANRCQISMASKELGYGKYRPAHDKPPYKPVAYAPRGFHAVEVDIIGKKSDASGSDIAGWKHSQKVVWEGDPNPNIETKEFSRCWWTDTTGSFSFLQRKFNFDWDGWKNGEPVLVVFDGGLQVPVTKTNKRHYPGAPGHVKWGVPKMDDGNPCKHFPSIAAPKDSTPEYAILYYGKE